MSEVRLEIAVPVAAITMQRAHRHNTLVPSFVDELRQAFAQADSADDVRAVLLAAEGSTFSTGGDVRGFWDHRDDLESYARATVGGLHALMVEMLRMPKPIVAAVHGMVTGGSIGLVLASDIVLVAPEASFTPWYSVVGFSPDGGWTALLPGLIGKARTADVLHTNRTIQADEAVAWGMASRIVEASDLSSEALRTSHEIAAGKENAQASIKQLLASDLDAIADRLAEEEDRFVEQILSEEAAGGMASFLGVEA